ncbi:MAG: rod shape-determining protein MreC [Gallionellales bacterium 35-53-114]|jgi:rod shape-determining protein MreC|nr:MAG: rod shape-determining protein MreC [Gallionellales bacterium 35-53-114]OYZ64374.1 MAG: rod shape-determining protein MreC [Gallionellales bacterium 24-53-125]OZB10317.1 MAG: rod shape-determining protein MreC [Gallionellales bacterium 39-52-133]HQS56920.1 rod shape-determining protein MreC [Gallionellaceae bacterium]HQS75296.1 rod shape-determining protein MreC [Gallionellaceae bacterium]
MDNTQSFRFFNRGPTPVARLIFFALLSLLLLFIDARYKHLESIRNILALPIQPLQRLATTLTTGPGILWDQFSIYVDSQGSLASENAQIRQQHAVYAAQLLQLQVLQAENEQLRKYFDLSQHADFPVQMAEIVYLERDIFKRKVYLDKGSQKNVLAGQVVMDEVGVVGQVTRVYPWLSEVTLITDKDHAVPIQVLRTGLRAVVFGSGNISNLTLRYMPISADIQIDDVLVTSGIDGTYPPGLPVARVIKIERDPAYPFAQILCAPLAGVDQQRQLMIISGLHKLPELPPAEAKEKEPKVNKTKRSRQ